MSESTFALTFLLVGVVMVVLGGLAVMRRRMTMVAYKHHRRVNENKVLRDGPAVLAGSGVALGGLWLVLRLAPGVLQGVPTADVSIGGPLLLAAAALLAGFAWQSLRNAGRVLADDEVQAKIAAKLQGVIDEQQSRRESQGPDSD